MLAGILSQAGYFMGESLVLGAEGSPKGYFTDLEVNSINDDILSSLVPEKAYGWR
jgi:hypothetical protein